MEKWAGGDNENRMIIVVNKTKNNNNNMKHDKNRDNWGLISERRLLYGYNCKSRVLELVKEKIKRTLPIGVSRKVG